MTVVLGRQDWPMPVPLVQEAQGWRFDTEAGLEEIDDRRVGRQRADRDRPPARLRRRPAGLRPGRPRRRPGAGVRAEDRQRARPAGRPLLGATGDAELSPLGPLVAEADAYAKDYHQSGEPYHGYYFKVLTRQGANPPGGAYDYVINGNMIAGFAMVAWPADYGHSGVMTFAVSHQGTVYETDLGDGHGDARPADHRLRPGPGLAGGRGGAAVRRAIKVAEVVAIVPDGATVMIGGFLAVGTPERLVDALVQAGRKDLVVIGNDTARPGLGIGKLIDARLCRKVIVSHIGTNPETQRQMLAGELEVELVPQGTLAERIRPPASGSAGADADRGRHGRGRGQADARARRPHLPGRAPAGGDFALIKPPRRPTTTATSTTR